MEGMELGLDLLCYVTVVLNTAAFLRQCVFRGEGFGSKYKTWEMVEEFARCSAGVCFFFVVFCPIASLQRSIVKLKIIHNHLS